MKALKQMQKVQADMARVQEELADQTVTATSGGGAVTAVVAGSQQLRSLVIDPDAVSTDDIEMLQDMIVAAVNEGLRMSQEMAAKEMEKVTGNLKIPGLT